MYVSLKKAIKISIKVIFSYNTLWVTKNIWHNGMQISKQLTNSQKISTKTKDRQFMGIQALKIAGTNQAFN
jgi:hypothetical protein